MLKKTIATKIFVLIIAVSMLMPETATLAFAEDIVSAGTQAEAEAPEAPKAEQAQMEAAVPEAEEAPAKPEEKAAPAAEESADEVKEAPAAPRKARLSISEGEEAVPEEVPEEKGDAWIDEQRFETIQAAVDAAEDGDTILLKADFRENVKVTDKSVTIDLGGNTWKAKGGSPSRVITVGSGSDVTLKNGTVTGGKNLFAEERTIVNNGLLSIENMKFTGNTGGLIMSTGDLVITDSEFYENDLLKSFGGQQYLVYVDGARARTTLTNTVFRDNDRPFGGIIYAKGSSSSSRYQSDFIMKGCDIKDNVVGWYGSLAVQYGVNLTLEDTTVKENKCGDSQGYTGGLYCYKINIIWRDSAIYNNKTYSESKYANDIYLYTATSFTGEIPLPKDMSDHGKKLTGYRLMELSYNYEAKEPLTPALIGKLNQYYRDWTVAPVVEEQKNAICEYNGKGYTSIEAAAADAAQGGTITLLKDAKASDKITNADDLTIDLAGYTLTPKNKSGSIIQIAGEKATIKNGTVKGCESREAAIHSTVQDLTVENVDFIDNADAGLYQYHMSPISGADPNPAKAVIRNSKFINNGNGASSYNPSALQIVATTVDVTGCTFDKNRAGLRFWESFRLDNSIRLNVEDCSFTGHKVRVMELGVPGGSLATFSNVRIEDNKVDGSYDAICHFKQNGYGADTHAGDVVFNNSTIRNNEGAQYTVRADGGNLIMNNSLMQGNVAENAGAIYVDVDAALTLRDTVIKENKATDTAYTCSGGIVLFAANVVLISPGIGSSAGSSQELGFYASGLNMQGGALYNNSTNMSSPSAEDLFVARGCKITVPKVSEFVDGDKDFSGLEWKDDATGEVVETPNSTSGSRRYYMAGAKKIMRQVYVDGTKGDDSNEGVKSAPVKTIEKAKELADTYGAETILVLGTVTYEKKDARKLKLFTDEEPGEPTTVDLGGKTVKRDPSLTKEPLIKIAGGADVTLKNTVVDGNSKVYVKALAPLVMVEKGGKLTLDEGASLENNAYHTTYTNPKGGAVWNKGDIVMKDGSRIYNNYAITGGGVYVDGGNFTMNGGVIDENTALWRHGNDYSDSYGGGVCVVYGGTMTMTGGTISNNEALRDGGGISLGAQRTDTVTDGGQIKFYMTGGEIVNNRGYAAAGGIYVQVNTEATITGGSISNNRATNSVGRHVSLFAGGGIYVNGYHASLENAFGVKHGKLNLMNVEIAENTADYEGGAIAFCGSGFGNVSEVKGTVIYDNDSFGEGNSAHSKETGKDGYNGNYDVFFDNVIYPYDYSNERWITNEFGYFEAVDKLLYTSYFGERMLNGASYDWYDEEGKTVPVEELHSVDKLMRLNTDATASDKDVQASVKKAKVHINGNSSATNGGGIGCNGEIYMGQLPDYRDIDFSKVWKDDADKKDRPSSIKVWLVRDGKRIDSMTVSKDNDWKGSFEDLPVYEIKNGEMDRSHKYEYTLEEDMTFKAEKNGKAIGDLYTAEVEEGEDGNFTITNTRKPEPPKEETEEDTPKFESEPEKDIITGDEEEKTRKYRTPPSEDEEEVITGETEEETVEHGTPKTGDNSLLLLWLLITLVYVAALLAFHRKRQ